MGDSIPSSHAKLSQDVSVRDFHVVQGFLAIAMIANYIFLTLSSGSHSSIKLTMY